MSNMNIQNPLFPVTLPMKWKDAIIPGYFVRSDGLVTKWNHSLSSWKINGRNYSRIVIDGHGWSYRIDYIVAYTFLKKPKDAIRLVHINGDISDDNAFNLMWFTKSDIMEEYREYAIIEDDGSIKEEWRPCITEYNPNLGYSVSNLGSIRNRNNHIVPKHVSMGYEVFYYLDPDNANTTRVKLVHRAVAEAFIPNPYNYDFVNHIDGNKLNNVVSNLEWVDRGMNAEHAYLQGLNTRSGYSEKQIEMVCRLLILKVPHVQIERMTGVDRKTISDVYRGRRWINVSSKFTMPSRRWTKEMKSQITSMIISGMKGREIFEKLNVPYDQAAISLYERIRRELKIEGKIE